MIPFDLHYQWPSAVYLILLVIPALLCFWVLFAYRQKLSFAKEMVLKRSSTTFWTKSVLFLCVIILCSIALMQPVGNGHYPEGVVPKKAPLHVEDLPLHLRRKAHDVIFLIDASASMRVPDTRLKKSRLDYAKILADEIIATLTGETVSLYAFTSDVSKLAPLTLDYLFTRLMIKEIQINEGGIQGTDFANLLQKMRANFFSEGASPAESSRLKTFILLSDGEDTTLEFFPEAMKNKGLQDLSEYLQDAAQNHVRFYTIGMGSASGGIIPEITDQGNPVISHLNSNLLKLLANIGRGKYYEANLYTPAQLIKDLLGNMSKDPPYYEEKQEAFNSALMQALFGENALLYDRYFQVPLALAILCLAFILLFPDSLRARIGNVLRTLLLLFCFVGLEAKGDEPANVTEIYRAKAYAEAKMYEQARSLFEGLLLMPLSEQQKAALQYNIGTTYLEEGSWDQAIRVLNETASKKNLQLFLYRKLYTNLSLAQYEKALSFDKNAILEALKQLREALKTSENLPEEEQAKLKMAIKGKILFLEEMAAEEKAMKENEIDQIQRLYNGVSEALEALHFLENQEMNNQLREEYIALFVEQQKQWIPFWRKNKKSPLFEEALNAYMKFTKATANGELSKAIDLGKASKNYLSTLMDQLAQGSLLQEKLRRLLNGYQQLLIRKSWKNKPWESLQQLYEAVEKVEGIKEISFEMNRSKQELTQAIGIFHKGDPDSAQLLFQDAVQWIKIASAKTFPMASKNLLETMIQQQEYLVALSELLLEKQSEKELKNLLEPLLLEGQKTLQPLGNFYFSTLYQEQMEAYSKQGLCQSTPWGEVLPLVDNGNKAAADGEARLADIDEDWRQRLIQVRLLQKLAIDQWQKALAETNHPTAQSSSCLGGGTGSASPVSASTESLTTLLQMETQDKKPAAPIEAQKTVLHPW